MSEKKAELNEALIAALREMGEVATPDELRAQGVHRVRRVSREMVSRLIEKAVNRTLMARTIGVPEPELRELISDAQREFYKITGTQDEIDRTRAQVAAQRTALSEELTRIREELASHRTFEDMAEGRPRAREDVERREDDELLQRVRSYLRNVPQRGPELTSAENDIVQHLQASLEAIRASAYQAGLHASGERVLQLERRVAKLVKSLADTELVLQRVAAMKELDVGLESIYRNVQGLSTGDSFVEAKRQLMQQIFEKNLELRRATEPQPAT